MEEQSSRVKNISYIALLRPENSSGVYKKIVQTVNSLCRNGYDAQLIVIDEISAIRKIFAVFKSIWLCRSQIIIYRHNVWTVLFFPAFFLQRLKGTKIVIDVPTPTATNLLEILGNNKYSRVKKLALMTTLVSTTPWCLWPASKVVQYAEESFFFSLGLKSKMVILSNGINVSEIPLRQQIPKWPQKTFVLIGVATISNWHGFDRVKKGISSYFRSGQNIGIDVCFLMVGCGPARLQLEDLARELQILSKVRFTGFQAGAVLNELFTEAHVGVSSLGLHRIGLKGASVLKSREYSARGLPFVFSGKDTDFDPVPNFAFKITNDDSDVNIRTLIDWYSSLMVKPDLCRGIRQYATEKLDFSIKTRDLLS